MNDFEGLTREEVVSVAVQLYQQNQELAQAVSVLRERVGYLEKENEALRSQVPGGGKGNGVPPFVKLNRKERREGEKEQRKKRKKSFARRRETPTEEIPHPVKGRCPDCGGSLSKPWEHSRRQVIEIPKTPVRIIDHVLMARRCQCCGKVLVARVGIEDGVIGKHRVGIGLMSVVATLSTAGRIPQRTIQKVLKSLYQVHISEGEISHILHEVAERGKETVDRLLEEVRGSPVAHGDETGAREDGMNGFLWSFSTPRVRYFWRDASRGAKVAQDILSDRFEGVLVCDFYAGYNWYSGPKQRCWVHYARDLKGLKEEHSGNGDVVSWVDSVLDVYKTAKKVAKRKHSEKERGRLASMFEEKLLSLARPYLKAEGAPQRTLAKRVEQFNGEFFTFVRYAGVPSDNNAAERAIRPAVTARKISGGTRSPRGSKTKSALFTLFGTWALREKDLLEACSQMLASPASA